MSKQLVSILSTVNLKTMQPVKVIWVMLNDFSGATLRQSTYLTYPTILKHFWCKGFDDKGNMILEPYNDNVEVKLVEIEEVKDVN